MTKEQIEILERWIVAIIRDEDRAADLYESVRRREALTDVIDAFVQKEQS